MDLVTLLSRFLHVLSAIVVMGGAMFTLLVLIPAARELPEEAHAGLKERVGNKWRKLVGMGILLLLVTGFYNYLVVLRPLHKGDGQYHMLMGIKILLAMVVFFLGSALAGRSNGLAFIRRDANKWLTVLVIVATGVVALGSALKVRGLPGPKVESSAMAPADAAKSSSD